MNILFDVWLRDNGKVKYTFEQEVLFETVWNYVHDRIAYLADDMDDEENDEDPPTKSVMIYLAIPTPAIQPKGYSRTLTDKINGSFNEFDNLIMWKSVEDKLKSFLS